MRTPLEIIGAAAVAALEAEGYVIAEPSELCDEDNSPIPLRSSYIDADGVEHQIEHYSMSYAQWREIYLGG